MSTANGDDYRSSPPPQRTGPILPYWFYLLLGLLVVGLMRVLEELHR